MHDYKHAWNVRKIIVHKMCKYVHTYGYILFLFISTGDHPSFAVRKR